MSPETVFRIHLALAYVAWLLCFGTYVLPKLRSMSRFEAHRAIATVHSFRFFWLVFIVPGIVGPNLLASFATFAAYGTSQPEYWPSWRSSRQGYDLYFGLSSSRSISWGQLTSSSITTMPLRSTFLRWRGNWALPMRSQSSTCRS